MFVTKNFCAFYSIDSIVCLAQVRVMSVVGFCTCAIPYIHSKNCLYQRNMSDFNSVSKSSVYEKGKLKLVYFYWD